MTSAPLPLTQQLAVCQQVARLARARLPLTGELSKFAQHAAPENRSAAAAVESDLLAGQSLSEALVKDTSRNSRILVACIEAGQQSRQLDKAIESWTNMHVANAHAARALRSALAYPLLLITITLLSLGYVIWTLIPEYQQTYAMFSHSLPAWLTLLVYVRAHFAWLLITLVVLSFLPLIIWVIHRRRFDSLGLPREQSRRLRLRALASELAGLMIDGNVPLAQLVPLCVSATGAVDSQIATAFTQLQNRSPIEPLARETFLLLTTLHAGLMQPAEAAQHLSALAQLQRHQADQVSVRQARWLPMLVALVVGLLTILTYVFLIYLPWLLLLEQIATPPALDFT